MNIRVPLLDFPALLLFVSCATQEPKVTGWLGSEVFKMPPGAFMSETLELKDGRFRYWFSSDVIIRGGQKYPIEGNYAFKGDELALSSGKVLKVRQINGRRVLLWPLVVEDCSRSRASIQSRRSRITFLRRNKENNPRERHESLLKRASKNATEAAALDGGSPVLLAILAHWPAASDLRC